MALDLVKRRWLMMDRGPWEPKRNLRAGTLFLSLPSDMSSNPSYLGLGGQEPPVLGGALL